MIIDQLPEISTVQDTDEIPIERGTTTYKSPLSKIWARLTAAFGSNVLPNMDGTAAIGSSDKYARADHVHPHDNLIVRPNLLDNAYFVGGGSQGGDGKFPINQRGQTSYNAPGYSIDRWKVDGYVTLTLNNGYITITKSDSAAYRGINQRIEVSGLTGKTVTLSILCMGGSTGDFRLTVTDSNIAIVKDAYPNIGVANTEVIHSVSFTATDDVLWVCLRPYNVSSLMVKAVKLEIGSTQTLAHQENGSWVLNEIPNYGEELAKCQRYLQVLCADSGSNGAALGGYAFNTSSIRVSVPLACPMARLLSASLLSGSISSVQLVSDAGNLTPTAVSAFYLPGKKGSIAMLGFTVSGATVGKTYWVNSRNFEMLLSCEP